MRVVGGVYHEQCFLPRWDQIFGSAGRAACLISAVFGHKSKLSGWYSRKRQSAIFASFAPYNLNLDLRLGRGHYVFAYANPISQPDCYLSGRHEGRPHKTIADESVLLFGAIEGIPPICADTVVFDPQGANLFDILDRELISAKRIAIVANEREIAEGPTAKTEANVHAIFSKNPRVLAVIVKCGPFGALAFDRKSKTRIPAYESKQVFKIGSGDIFSAAFAFLWAYNEREVALSADFASRAVACYADDPYLNFKKRNIENVRPISRRKNNAQIYLAAPFFSVADFLVLAEVRRFLTISGAKVFSPFHQVGYGASDIIAKKDLRALKASQCVLALLHNCDPGTLFEAGFARSIGVPVVAVCENAKASDITMLAGTGSAIETDLCTGAYKSIWTAFGHN